MGSNVNVRRAVLEFLIENPEFKTSKGVQKLIKFLNLAGGVKNIPMMKLQELKTFLDSIKD